MTGKKKTAKTNGSNSSDLKPGTPGYSWCYFELHANQRISLFRNFVFILTVYITGIGFLIVKFHDTSSWIEEISAIALSVVFIFVTIIFWFLDTRNKNLIHIAEDSLKIFEDKIGSHPKSTHTIFQREMNEYRCELRHTLCFRILFGIAITAAIFVIFFSLTHICYETQNYINKIEIHEAHTYSQTKTSDAQD